MASAIFSGVLLLAVLGGIYYIWSQGRKSGRN